MSEGLVRARSSLEKSTSKCRKIFVSSNGKAKYRVFPISATRVPHAINDNAQEIEWGRGEELVHKLYIYDPNFIMFPGLITKHNTRGGTKGDGQTLVRNGSNMRDEDPIKGYVHSLTMVLTYKNLLLKKGSKLHS
ncbi:hypothetical protein M9H77_13566 [Catharanthus roseus]|uniref:Uncharacterized protein n=1 Tax=Catharanthus roseus TaxID=4058 RepID=A0ACC0BKS1_CATRO|nr:hypothetical protein M9H77_13566 [Catharanthus roseus]